VAEETDGQETGAEAAGADAAAMADTPNIEPAPPPEEPKMEIHKPKPVHNWREFLTEIGVVVIGVCIALAAEQAVEWLHWQSEVKAARAALHTEITANNAIFLTRRLAIAPCLERQAQEAGRILDDLEAKRPPGRFTVFRPENGSLLNFNEWESERAAQTLTHFPREELALIGNYYDQLADEKIWMLNETTAWHELSVLRHPPGGIGVSDILRLRTALENADEDERLIVLNTRRQLSWSGQLGIAAKPYDPAQLADYCKPA
jgi:hypothetical protein